MRGNGRLVFFEKLVLAGYLGLGPVMVAFLVTVLAAATAVGIERLGPWLLWGLAPGLVLDVVFIKRWMRAVERGRRGILAGWYVFYSVVGVGMCMGIPLCQVFLGILAGWYGARKVLGGDSEVERLLTIRRVSLFAALVMGLVCLLAVLWGGVGGMVGSRFESPIVTFRFTLPVYLAVGTGATIGLMLFQYSLTFATGKLVGWRFGRS
jgi:hypothetical protein